VNGPCATRSAAPASGQYLPPAPLGGRSPQGQPPLTILAAAVLAVESLVFVWVHVKYREAAPTILSAVLGLLLAFIAYGRLLLAPIF